MAGLETIAKAVAMRAENQLSMEYLGHKHPDKNFGYVTYPIENGDWAIVPLHDKSEPPKTTPPCVQIMFADRLIERVLEKLNAMVSEQPIPVFEDHRPNPPANEYAPCSDFFKKWEKDEQDRWVYVGLDHGETQEFLKLQGLTLVGDDLEINEDGVVANEADDERFLQLDDRYELARKKRIDEKRSETTN